MEMLLFLLGFCIGINTTFLVAIIVAIIAIKAEDDN